MWSINVAKEIDNICDILVSTDDSAIAEVSRDAGALVPWLRPEELATDTASSMDVCLHALNWYEGENGKIDGLLLLQPTSPFRSSDTVVRGIDLFKKHKRRAIIGVSPVRSHPIWCFQVEDDSMRPFMDNEYTHVRSQDLPPAYTINGAFYLIAPDDLRKQKSFFSDDMVPLLINEPIESLDIDTDWDWMMAEAIIRSKGSLQC